MTLPTAKRYRLDVLRSRTPSFSRRPCSQSLMQSLMQSTQGTTTTMTKAKKLIIQTAGTDESCKGPSALCNSISIFTHRLKNPYLKVKHLSKEDAIKQTKSILKKECSAQLNDMLAKGKHAIISGKNVTILCKYGRHRSRAVAELLKEFSPNLVCVHHCED